MKMSDGYPKRLGDTEEKGEIARFEQFLLFPIVFSKKLVLQTRKRKKKKKTQPAWFEIVSSIPRLVNLTLNNCFSDETLNRGPV